MSTVSGTVRNPSSSLELSHINEELYKKNAELAGKNKVLSLLSEIDQIILSTVNDPMHISERVAQLIVREVGFRAVGIFILKDNTLQSIGMELSGNVLEDEKKLLSICKDNKIATIKNTENLLVQTLNEKQKKATKYLFDVLNPMTDLHTASTIQSNLQIKVAMAFPLLARNEMLGVLLILLNEDEGSMSTLKTDIMSRLANVIGIAIDNALLYQKIQEANIKLKQLDKLKDELVSITSHELRTPMTVVRSYLWMLMQAQNGALNEKQKMYIDKAYGATVRLIHLINDMLDTSRIESGRMSLNFEAVNLYKLSQDVVAEVLSRAQLLGLTVKCENRMTPLVHADAEKIREVLINLIGNSLKFTPRGGSITIAFEVGDDSVTTKVIDTGMGFTQEYQSKLFMKYGFIKTSYETNKSDAGGTGLGLYICKSIIDMHGGSIQAKSDGSGKGATFSFILKLHHEKV